MECHRETWNWWICHMTWSCTNFEIFLIEKCTNKQASNKQFQKVMLNECWSINLYLLLRLWKKWLPLLHLFNLLQSLKLSLKYCFTKFLYQVSNIIFVGTSFCGLCQNLCKPQKLFQFPQGIYFSLKSFLTFFRLPKITRVKTHLKSRLKNEVAHHCYQMNWWWKLFLWWKLCAWEVLQ